MSDLLIALLPPVPEQSWPRREIAAELAAYHYDVKILDELATQPIDGDLDLAGAWVAHCALELAARSNRAPVLLVAYGAAGRMLAALGFAQRASRRRVVGYVLVDGDLPKPGVQDWPDAPVTYLGTKESHLAELRGWDLLPGKDTAGEIRQVADRWV